MPNATPDRTQPRFPMPLVGLAVALLLGCFFFLARYNYAQQVGAETMPHALPAIALLVGFFLAIAFAWERRRY